MGSMGGGSVKDQWRDSGDGVQRVGVGRSGPIDVFHSHADTRFIGFV